MRGTMWWTLALFVICACAEGARTGVGDAGSYDASADPIGPGPSADAASASDDAGRAADAGTKADAAPPAPACTNDFGCAQGICNEGACVPPECSDAAPCGAGASCERGRCVSAACGVHTFVYDPMGRTVTSVAVAGTFNDWDFTRPDAALALDAASGTYRRDVQVGQGTHEYKLVIDGKEWLVDPGNPDQVTNGNNVNSRLTITCPFVCASERLDEFDWRDTVLYFAMLDRFRDGDGQGAQPAADGSAANPRTGYGGGDLAGLRNELDYLADLGVTALWITSPAQNQAGGYHGYWPAPENIDFSNPAQPSPRPRVDARLGDESALAALIDAAHAASSANGHGIKVLLDYVMKHVSDTSGLHQAHPEWFYRENGKVRECNGGTPDNPSDDLWNDDYYRTRCGFNGFLPPFDFDGHPDARAWSVADAVWWASTLGVDGLRLDAIKHVPEVWLAELRTALWNAIPAPAGGRFVLIGETFDFDRAALRPLVRPDERLDGQFDFPLRQKLCEATLTRTAPMSSLAAWMVENDRFYGDRAIMTTWLGNHDVPRPIHLASGEITSCTEASFAGNSRPDQFIQPADAAPYERMAVAFALQMTGPGMPMIYYGDEVGLRGGGDPESRRMMPWDDAALNEHQKALRARMGELAKLRARARVLGRGERVTVSATDDTWVFRMQGCEPALASVLVAINRGDEARTVEIPKGSYEDLLGGGATTGGARELAPRSYLFLRQAP